jgi:hypothetical protein
MDEIQYKGYTIKIEQDQFADDPRHADYDNLGTIVYKHKDYKLGDREVPEYWIDDEGNEQYINDAKDLQQWLTHEYGKIAVQFPVYLYEHSGLRLKIGSFEALPQGHKEFDSGQVGIIFVTQEKLEKEGLTKKQAESNLRGEITTLDQYVSGEVYTSYVYESKRCDECGHEELEEVDGQGNVYGYDEALGLAHNCIDNLTGSSKAIVA